MSSISTKLVNLSCKDTFLQVTVCRSKMHSSWFCLHRVQKNKINIGISSTIVFALIVSYGTHDRSQYKSNSAISWPETPLHVEEESNANATSFLCYTNNVKLFPTLRLHSKNFPAKVSATDLVFLTVGSDIKNLLKLKHLPIQNPCFTLNDTYLLHCCGYSPHSKQIGNYFLAQDAKFVYKRRVVTDNYFRIEDVIYGKPEMVDLLINFSLKTSDKTRTDVVSSHRCRSDILVDQYPEIHIYVDTQYTDGNLTKNAFHWYL